MPILRDIDIRVPLITFLKKNIVKSSKNEVIVSEMGLCHGKSIVDLAIINGHIQGYEIKSDTDTLYRLNKQLEMYVNYFSYITVVCTTKHIEEVLNGYPSWIGIMLVSQDHGLTSFKVIRKPKLNKNVSTSYIVKLFWKEELENALSPIANNIKYKYSSKTVLQKLLLDSFSYSEILELLKRFVNTRVKWQVV